MEIRRKTFTKTSLLALLAALVLMQVELFAQLDADPIEKVVPADAILYINAKDLDTILRDFKKTALWKIIKDDELLDGILEAATGIQRAAAIYLTGVPADELRRRIGKHIALALIDVPRQQNRGAPPPIAILVDVSHDIEGFQRMFRQIENRIKSFRPRAEFGESVYRGVKVEILSLPKAKFLRAAIFDGVFVLGSEEVVYKLIDTSQGASSLADNPVYTAVKEKVGVPSGVMIYLNIEPLWTVSRMNPRQRAGLEAAGLAGIRAIAASTSVWKNGFKDRLFVYTGPEKKGIIKAIFDEQPFELSSVNLIPPSYIAYVGLRTPGGRAIYREVRNAIRESQGDQALAQLDLGLAQFGQVMGLSVENDIIGNIGNEAFVAMKMPDLAGIIEEGRKPMPTDFNIAAGVEVKDVETLKLAINQFILMLAQQGVSVSTEDYQGVEIGTITTRNPNLTPAYAFVKSFFIFCLNGDDLKEVIDTLGSSSNLANSSTYKEANEALPDLSNARLYVDLEAVATGLTEVLAVKAPPPIEPFVPTIQRAASQLFPLGVTLSSDENGIIGEGYSPIGGPFWLTAFVAAGTLDNLSKQQRIQPAAIPQTPVAPAQPKVQRGGAIQR